VILSIHIPKAGGTGFGHRLQAAFGSRLLRDYGDLIGFDTQEAATRRTARIAEARARRDELLRDYDVIHGHFTADKYAGLFPTTDVTAFFREPHQQAMSHYEFLMRHPQMDNPAVKLFHELRIPLTEFVERTGSLQAAFLGSMDIGEFAVVGLMEHYERSVALFEAAFGRKLPREAARANANPDRRGERYEIGPELRRAVALHRAGDVEVYRRACERFGDLCERYGV
jgi:hypothetical protein